MEILAIVKSAIRITTDTFDEAEITPIIEASKIDLRLAGVNNIQETDPLIQRAIILYAKAHFGYSDDSERYLKAYQDLKAVLAIMTAYNTVVENVE